MKFFSLLIFSFLIKLSFSQSPTVGLIYNSGVASSGYTLFTPEQNTDVFLIDDCGEVVNKWICNDLPGNVSYLLENGNLLYAGKDNFELRDWNDNLLWEYPTTVNGIKQHHDIEPLPNGNILCIVTDNKTSAELIAAGRDPNTIGNNFKMDKIFEIEPVGTSQANIVWEWYFWDHLIQEFDSTKTNFGVVADHPELINLNFLTINNSDWTHLNGIDYNAELDQIILSSRTLSEIYIIDHSTTTAESASHSGGNAGKGGDFLWRWGNPIVYQQGTVADQKLFGQHDSKWVEEGYLHDGKISVFNNFLDGSLTNSSINLIQPTLSGTYNYVMTGSMFEPANFDYTWSGDVMGDPLYSNIKGGANALPNGGFMICETIKGRFIEINEAGDVVWVYRNPSAATVFNQFDVLAVGDNHSFRAEKYQLNYPGIVGNDVTPSGIIEDVNSLSAACISSSGIEEVKSNEIAIINPIVSGEIKFIDPTFDLKNLELYDLSGKLIQKWMEQSPNMKLSTNVGKGVYLFRFEMNGMPYQQRILIQ